MANKTRGDIKNRIYQYLPQINQTAKATLINESIDLAAEEISQRHDFRCMRVATPDVATLAAGEYSLDLTDFGSVGSASANFKDFLEMRWLKTGTSDYGKITFMDDKQYHDEVGYIDYTGRTAGKPSRYTRLKDTLFFDSPADEDVIIRAWWQKQHGAFASDGDTHRFAAKDNMAAFDALTYSALFELKNSLNSVEFPEELQGVGQLAEAKINKLIARDKDIANEEITFCPGERRGARRNEANPYDWI